MRRECHAIARALINRSKGQEGEKKYENLREQIDITEAANVPAMLEWFKDEYRKARGEEEIEAEAEGSKHLGCLLPGWILIGLGILAGVFLQDPWLSAGVVSAGISLLIIGMIINRLDDIIGLLKEIKGKEK